MLHEAFGGGKAGTEGGDSSELDSSLSSSWKEWCKTKISDKTQPL